MKNLILILATFLLASCMSSAKKEAVKSAKHGSASGRVNSSQSNNNKILDELDE